ncbi:MAG: MFS transporter [Bdellovibrionaceae bacterium]|nr:MFS transporter [Bdellovibrio sp.]
MLIKIERYKYALLFACLSMFVLGLADNIRGPLFADLMNFFKLTNSEGSLSFAVTSAAALFGNIVTAPLMRKMTLARLLLLSVFLMMVGLFFMAISPTFTFYLLSALIFGFSFGLMGVVQNLIVAENIDSEKQPKYLSALHGIYGFASLLAPLLASRAPELLGPWRSAFYVTSAICFLVLISGIFIYSLTPFEIHQISQAQLSRKAPRPLLFAIGGILAFYVTAEIMVATRLALYMRTAFNMNLEQSSNYVSYFFVFLLIGRILFAVKTFSYSLKQQLNASLILSLIFLGFGLWVHPFLLTVVGLAMAPFYPISVAYISDLTGVDKRKFITFAISFQSLCVITMHMGVGFLTDRYGLFYAFGVAIVSLLLSLVCVNFHPKISST